MKDLMFFRLFRVAVLALLLLGGGCGEDLQPKKDGPVVKPDTSVSDLALDKGSDGSPKDGGRDTATDAVPDAVPADTGTDGSQTKQVPCDADNGNPANSSDVIADVTVTYDPSTKTWSAPAKCAWTCDATYCKDGGACLASKPVPCDANNSNPANSTDTVANVTVTCQSNGTFSTPTACDWTCNATYCKDGNACLASKSAPCDANNSNPANSTDTVANVTVTCQSNGTFSTAAGCDWTCDASYCRDGNACLASKSAPCDPNNNNPANSSDVATNVTLTCQSNGTFSTPTACSWKCDANYCQEGNACLTSKTVTCDPNNNNPANSSDVIANVIVACQSSGTFGAPPVCGWTCDSGYTQVGLVCQLVPKCVDMNPAIDLDGNGVADCSETLVSNSQFTTGTLGWIPGTSASLAWSSSDATGSSSSGSAQVTNGATNPGSTSTGVYQCIPVAGPQAVVVYANAYVPGGQASTPTGRFGIWSYATADCTGTFDVFNASQYFPAVDTWQMFSRSFTVPNGHKSVRLWLNVNKPAGPSLVIRYDNILFK